MKLDSKKLGTFVSIEGIDGSGKTTIIKYIVDKINNLGSETISTFEVGGTVIGKELRKICFTKREDEVVDPLARLLMIYASRIQHIRNVIEPNILKGINVVTDRFNESTSVYNGIIDGMHREMISIEAVTCMRFLASKSDILIYLDIDPKIAFERGIKRESVDNDVYKNKLETTYKVYEAYKKVIDERMRKYPHSVYIVNANLSLPDVYEQLDDIINFIITDQYLKIPKSV